MNLFPTWISRPLAALSLRARLALAFGLALLLIGTLMGISLSGARHANEAITRLRNVDFAVHDAILRIENRLLEARRQEKEFLLRWREFGVDEARTRWVNQLRADLAGIPAELATIDRLRAGEPETAKLTAEVGRAVADYQRDFLAVVDLVGRLGFVDSGLEGSLRATAHAMEALIPASEPALRVALLQLRRQEKDYLLRGRIQDVTSFHQADTRFRQALARAALDAPLRTQLAALSRDYREKFEEYTRVCDEIEALRHAYLHAAARTEAPLDRIHDQAEARADATRDHALAVARSLSATVLGAGTLVLLLGALGAALLWRSIVRSVDGTVTFAEKVAAGDLSARIPAQDGGEFRRLASALDLMADSLQRSHDELRALNAELEQRVAQRTLHLRAANRGLTESSREMGLLADLSQALLASEQSAEAHHAIASFFVRLRSQSAGRLYIRRGNTGIFDGMAEWGQPSFATPLTVPSCLALREELPQCACSDHPGGACPHPPVLSPRTSALCVPLVSQNETFGMIYLELPATGGASGAEIDPADRMLATIIGRQLALGLSNLRLRETLREQSIRDVLTGLYNRRYLEETLAREIERARRKQGKLAAIMLDVDHFKRYNDDYGHEAGDAVLAAIGRLIKDNVRASDVPCRFGGEEFTVLLPDSDAVLAAERAELLRRAAHDLKLEFEGKTLPSVTISLGVAESPLHGETGVALLAAADAALYRAKQGGRDRAEIAGEPEFRMESQP